MAPLTVQLPDHLLAALETLDSSPQDIIIQALETYLQTHAAASKKARTWELCGKFDLATPSLTTTNHAEQIDTVLYDRLTDS
jgi:hypothetical protein